MGGKLNKKALILAFTIILLALYISIFPPYREGKNILLVDLTSKSARCFMVHACGSAFMENGTFITHVKNETGYGIGVWADGFPPHSWDTGEGQKLEVDVSKLSEDRLWLEIVLEREDITWYSERRWCNYGIVFFINSSSVKYDSRNEPVPQFDIQFAAFTPKGEVEPQTITFDTSPYDPDHHIIFIVSRMPEPHKRYSFNIDFGKYLKHFWNIYHTSYGYNDTKFTITYFNIYNEVYGAESGLKVYTFRIYTR